MRELCSVEECENLAVFDTGLCLEHAAPDPETAHSMHMARGYRLDGSPIAQWTRGGSPVAQWIQVDTNAINQVSLPLIREQDARCGDLDE